MKPLTMTLAAALVAMAAPAWAQTTGTLEVSGDAGFSMTETATLVNHEWVINYSADIAQDFSSARRVCRLAHDANTCNLDPPYFVKYGQAPGGRFSCGVGPSALRGHSLTISSTSWQQTVRAHPNTSYCINVYTHGGYFQNNLITAVWFRTPPDPSPAPASSSGWGTGCFADPRGYAECNRLRTACNNDPSTTWEQSRNRCIPASN